MTRFYAFTLAMVCASLVALASDAPSVASLPADVLVHDGDTIRVRGVLVRLSAIDAPELSQRCHDPRTGGYACGVESRDALASMIAAGGDLRCDFLPKPDRYGRQVGTCRNDVFGDLGEAMVREGEAVAYLKYGGDRYLAAQDDAKRRGVGIWRGPFEDPSAFRQRKRQ